MQKVIKNHRNKNRYCLTSTGLWVRDFTKQSFPEDINKLVSKRDYEVMLNNEMSNATLNLASIDGESIFAPNVIIASDGFDFKNKQNLLKDISQNQATIIGVNKSLYHWNSARRMDWYVANNPYKECLSFLPKSYFPRCIVSTRTNPEFVKKYRRAGVVYKYTPSCDKNFASGYFVNPLYYVDDYRNPVCAAMSLAFRWGARKVLLFCCDDAFVGERSGAEQLNNGLWMYPQHKVSHGLIEGCAYWLKQSEIKIGDYSSGVEYKDIEYISEDKVRDFFKDE